MLTWKPLYVSQELKDPQCRDEMAAARGALKKNATMLYTASQAFLRHPDVAATRANRDYVFKQVQEAIGGISSAAQATSPTDEKHGHAGIGELAAALNEFDVSHATSYPFFRVPLKSLHTHNNIKKFVEIPLCIKLFHFTPIFYQQMKE